MSNNKKAKSCVGVDIGPRQLTELAAAAKKAGTSRGALARAFILAGLESLKNGQLEIAAGVNLLPKSES